MEAIRKALYAQLNQAPLTTHASISGVYLHDALDPNDLDQGYVIFEPRGTRDEYTLGGQAYEVARYMIKAIVPGNSADAAEEAAELAHALVQDQDIVIAGYGLMSLRRTQRIEYQTLEHGVKYHHRGGIYQIYYQQTA